LHDATPDAGFGRPDLTVFCRLDELGLVVTGQRLDPDRAVLACRVVDPDDWCRRCGCQGVPRGTVIRRLAHEPFGWRPTSLHVTVRRYRCSECGHVWRQDTTKAAQPRAKLSRRGLRWALEGLVVQHLTVARVADGLGVSWNTANNAARRRPRALIDDPHRFDGVQVIGVPKPLNELITLGRTLKKRDVDVLAYFDRPCSSNGPTEAINGRLETPSEAPLGFRNLTNDIARCLLEAGGFRPRLSPRF
jgi:transposase